MMAPQQPPVWSRDWSAPSDWDAPTGPIPVVRKPQQSGGFRTGHKVALTISAILVVLWVSAVLFAMTASAAPYPTMPPGAQGPFTVINVVDGDTIHVDANGQRLKIRMIGLDTPETVDPREPVRCFGGEASAQAKTILGGQSVYLETDPSQDTVDRYGRTLAYVWTASGRLFNLDMISDGYAFEYTYDLPYHYQQDFKAAENDARTQERGLWSPNACAA